MGKNKYLKVSLEFDSLESRDDFFSNLIANMPKCKSNEYANILFCEMSKNNTSIEDSIEIGEIYGELQKKYNPNPFDFVAVFYYNKKKYNIFFQPNMISCGNTQNIERFHKKNNISVYMFGKMYRTYSEVFEK